MQDPATAPVIVPSDADAAALEAEIGPLPALPVVDLGAPPVPNRAQRRRAARARKGLQVDTPAGPRRASKAEIAAWQRARHAAATVETRRQRHDAATLRLALAAATDAGVTVDGPDTLARFLPRPLRSRALRARLVEAERLAAGLEPETTETVA